MGDAQTDGDVVVFLIGMRINRWRAVRQGWPVFTAMPKMLREQAADKNSGMLGYRLLFAATGLGEATDLTPSPGFLRTPR